MLAKVLFCLILFYLLSFCLANICPLEKHIVCNRNQDDHKCVCGAAEVADSPIPVKSCNLLLEIENDEFDAVSVTFDLTDKNEAEEDEEDRKESKKKEINKKRKGKKDDDDSDEDSEEDDDESEKFPLEEFRKELSNSVGANDEEIVIFRVGCNEDGDELTVQFGIIKKDVANEREIESKKKEKESKKKLKANEKNNSKDNDDDDNDDDDHNDKGKNNFKKNKNDKSDQEDEDDEEENEQDEFKPYEQDDFEEPETIVRRLIEKGKDREMAGIKVESLEKVEKLLLLEGVISNTLLIIMAAICAIFCILTCIVGCFKTFCAPNEEEHNPELDKLNNV
uniref:Uncharacterized protein n=1 Tax=Acrobeloides nanus TaxID=290746 RepID=A0A914DQI4_9BILA